MQLMSLLAWRSLKFRWSNVSYRHLTAIPAILDRVQATLTSEMIFNP